MITTLSTSGNTMQVIANEIQRDPYLKSSHTQQGYFRNLAKFESWRDCRPFTKLLVEEYLAHLQRAGRTPGGVNGALAAIRWWARKLGDLAYEDMSLTRSDRDEIMLQAARAAGVKCVRGSSQVLAGRHVPYGEISALLQACANDPTAAGARDAALIALGAATGARRFELASLQLANWTVTQGDSGAVTIRGKGDKTRVVDVFGGAFLAMMDWLAIRGFEPGPLFFIIRRGGHIRYDRGLTNRALAGILDKRARQAGISQRLTWHDLRRTLAGDLLDGGADIVTVQKVLGHSNPITTSRYDRRPDETRRRVLRERNVPYHGRNVA